MSTEIDSKLSSRSNPLRVLDILIDYVYYFLVNTIETK